mmetsp:Transcript_54545/g.152131  ORF Transcript_54545/g.152131 Transcript_54545/m.152131 type:complete len:250 (+) Transcript_54545:554-1303(+)
MSVRGVYHFWSHILGRPKYRVGFSEDVARETEIANFGVTFRIQQDVLWFQVPIGDASLVEVLERANDAAHVKHRCRARSEDVGLVAYDRVEHATVGQLHEHVHVLIVLVRPVKLHNEGVFDHRKDVALATELFCHAGFHDVALRHPFQCIIMAFMAHEEHRAEGPLAEQADPLKLFQRDGDNTVSRSENPRVFRRTAIELFSDTLEQLFVKHQALQALRSSLDKRGAGRSEIGGAAYFLSHAATLLRRL